MKVRGRGSGESFQSIAIALLQKTQGPRSEVILVIPCGITGGRDGKYAVAALTKIPSLENAARIERGLESPR